jgi:DNA recombination protein RmuC
MNLVYILIIVLILLLIILIATNFQSNKKTNELLTGFKYKLDSLNMDVSRIETSVKNEIVSNRNESARTARDAREETSNSLRSFGELISNATKNTSDLQRKQLETFSGNLEMLTKSLELRMRDANEGNANNAREVRRELKEALENMRATIEKKVNEMQVGNEKKLEEMRATVDEKLQTTLETRLGESFKMVSERLEAVHRGLGDMQQLAIGVGDLKKVLTNVKTRGVLGEYQLENLLEQLFSAEQYAKNVRTKPGSNAMVEFAVKMPGRDDLIMWLPIDSKFPKEDFELLMEAYDKATPEQIEECRRNFVRGIKKCAMDICSKYIDPPNTTDFAILFLPFESLYAEVLRTPGLFESIQRDCKIIIAGPTTLSAFLSSLQMGFRTLAIEKRSSEVWHLLGAVKTEFGHFGDILDKTQKKLQEASNTIERAGMRSRAIERKLKGVQELPQEESIMLLGEAEEFEEPEDLKELD